MNSRLLHAGLLMLALLPLVACSGHDIAVENSELTITFGRTAAKAGGAMAKAVFAGASSASNGYIPSIVRKITITVSGAGMADITRNITIAQGQTYASDSFSVPNGTARVIKVTAGDNYNNTPYTGSTTVDLAGGDTTVTVEMQEDINQAVTAKLYQYFKDTIETRGAALTAADLEPFYAQSFGMDNGLGRGAVMDRDLKDYQKGQLAAKGMVSLTATAKQLTPLSTGPYGITGKGFFKDGSFGFPDDGFTMIKEGGEWRITGNGHKCAISMKGVTAQWLGGPTSPRIESGISFKIEDRAGANIVSVLIKGPGLPAGGIVMASDPFFPGFLRLGSPYAAIPALPTMQYEMYVISDATLAAIPDNASYTFTIYDNTNTVVDTRTMTLPKRPWLRSEVTAAHFPAFSGTPPISPVSAATDGHYLADARIGGTLTCQLATPSAYAPSWFEAEFSYFGWGNTGKNGFYQDIPLLLTDTRATMSSVLPLIAMGGELTLTATDFDNNRDTRTVWLFRGPVNAGPISTIPFMTTTFQAVNGVRTPASGDFWHFGAAPPTVTWGGSLLTAPGIHVFLLADDPQKVALPNASGNPFPGAMWLPLTKTAVPGSSGALTLPAVETLGIAGSGCRILIASTAGDVWALSAPFTISP